MRPLQVLVHRAATDVAVFAIFNDNFCADPEELFLFAHGGAVRSKYDRVVTTDLPMGKRITISAFFRLSFDDSRGIFERVFNWGIVKKLLLSVGLSIKMCTNQEYAYKSYQDWVLLHRAFSFDFRNGPLSWGDRSLMLSVLANLYSVKTSELLMFQIWKQAQEVKYEGRN